MTPVPYNPAESEKKWQAKWEEAKLHHTDLHNAKKPYYSLVMFPYPSGDKLHVGHWYNFAPADSHARYMRMQGHDVFCPMGFDAFGLPAENHAIKKGEHPDGFTDKNVATMITQLKRIGCMYDWDRMVNTSKPEYYRWTQWLFVQMFQHGLAYKKEGNVNFCSSCQTVLANEQCQDGTCERCGTVILQKPLSQWYWKTSQYAQQLLDGLDGLHWPEKTKLMQRNWIGRSEGCEVVFEVENAKETITVFTTRVDTLYSAAFVVLAPEHPLVLKITTDEQQKAVQEYQELVKKKTDIERTDLQKEKTGVFTGSFVSNPVNGKKVPVWIGDFVLGHYGHGAVFGDAHDERDFIFAKKYGIPLTTTIRPADGSDDTEIRAQNICFSEDGILYDSDEFSGLLSADARTKIGAKLEQLGKGKSVINYRLRDWLLSRQRYWGAPIPIVYDPEGNPHPVPEEHLPWRLPTDVEFKPTGKSPLFYSKEFRERTENIFGKGWVPEFDTMDTFVCSSYYYLRYLATDGNWQLAIGQEPKATSQKPVSSSLIDPSIEAQWMPVSMYIGGPEHACMHLIYARFVMMALRDFGVTKHSEPFQTLVHQGLITNQGAKMSKSKGNVVSPDTFVDQYGSDVFRMYLMFMGPFTDGGDWSDTGIRGIVRFVDRFWKVFSLSTKVDQSSDHTEGKKEDSKEVIAALHRTIKKVTKDIADFHFNTAISALMEFLNLVEKHGCSANTAKIATLLLAPLAPHLAEELWSTLGGEGFVVTQAWPTYDEALTIDETITIVVQVNGKLRGELSVPRDISKEEILAQAKALENVQKYLTSTPKKEIYVAGKLVSFVV
jgi:leucyl-tRNA synthetase